MAHYERATEPIVGKARQVKARIYKMWGVSCAICKHEATARRVSELAFEDELVRRAWRWSSVYGWLCSRCAVLYE